MEQTAEQVAEEYNQQTTDLTLKITKLLKGFSYMRAHGILDRAKDEMDRTAVIQ